LTNTSRRRFLRYGIALFGGVLLTFGLGDLLLSAGIANERTTTKRTTSSTFSPGENLLPDYNDFLRWLASASKPYAGRSLKISLETEFTPISLQARDRDFLLATQISDSYSIKPYSLQLADISLLVQTKSPTYDAFSVDNQNLGVFKDALISPFELSQTYPELTYEQLDPAAFRRFVWDFVATYPADTSLGSGGNNSASVSLLPLDMPVMVQFYRKDIYNSLGLVPPNTWDEYFDDVKMMTGRSTPYGAVSQAAPDISIIYEFLCHLTSFGARLWEVDGGKLIPAMNSSEAVASLENFVRFEPYSDPASFTYSWADVFSSLGHGVSANGLLWHEYSSWINDPLRSQVVGNVGFSRIPAGPRGSYSTFGGAGIGVSRYSNNPEAAWLWLQWATAKGTQETLLLDRYHVFPSRVSPLQVHEIQDALGTSSYAAASLAKQIWDEGAVTGLIGFPKWYQVLDALSSHLNQAWKGSETPQAALNAAQQRIVNLGSLTF
jgi:multiple sugar transport system substrate-binding protein